MPPNNVFGLAPSFICTQHVLRTFPSLPLSSFAPPLLVAECLHPACHAKMHADTHAPALRHFHIGGPFQSRRSLSRWRRLFSEFVPIPYPFVPAIAGIATFCSFLLFAPYFFELAPAWQAPSAIGIWENRLYGNAAQDAVSFCAGRPR